MRLSGICFLSATHLNWMHICIAVLHRCFLHCVADDLSPASFHALEYAWTLRIERHQYHAESLSGAAAAEPHGAAEGSSAAAAG